MENRILERLFHKKSFSDRTKRISRIVLLLIFGLSLFFLLYSGWINRSQMIPLLQKADYLQLIGCLFYYLGSLIFAMLGWLAMIRTFNNSPGIWAHIKIYSITFASRRLPGSFWYVLGRIALLEQEGMAKTDVLVASALESLITLAIGGALGAALFLWLGADIPLLLTLAVAIISIFGLILSHPFIMRTMIQKSSLSAQIQANTVDWIIWIGLILLTWLMGGLMVSQMIKIFLPTLSVDQYLYVIASWGISGMAGYLTFLLPSSFGATELSLTFFLSFLIPLTLAGSISIAIRFFTLIMEVLLSALFYPFAIQYSTQINQQDTK